MPKIPIVRNWPKILARNTASSLKLENENKTTRKTIRNTSSSTPGKFCKKKFLTTPASIINKDLKGEMRKPKESMSIECDTFEVKKRVEINPKNTRSKKAAKESMVCENKKFFNSSFACATLFSPTSLLTSDTITGVIPGSKNMLNIDTSEVASSERPYSTTERWPNTNTAETIPVIFKTTLKKEVQNAP